MVEDEDEGECRLRPDSQHSIGVQVFILVFDDHCWMQPVGHTGVVSKKGGVLEEDAPSQAADTT